MTIRSVISGGVRRVILAIVVAVSTGALMSACGEEETALTLNAVEPTPGGQLSNIQMLRHEDEDLLVAPSGGYLFVRSLDENGEWEARSVDWPVRDRGQRERLFDVVDRAAREAKLSPSNYFAVHGDALWTVALDSPNETAHLFRSDDIGRSWSMIDLPDELRAGSEGGQSVLPGTIPAMRVSGIGDRLYLLDEKRIWEFSGELDHEEIWVPISLEGLPTTEKGGEGEDGNPRELPRRIEHYLPGDEDHRYEVITVLGRQLEIYRRGDGGETFEKVAELEGPARDLLRAPDGQAWYLVGANSLYKSVDDGESWTELDVISQVLTPEDFRQAEIFFDEDAEVGYQLWLVGTRGSLWRSADGGENWEVIAERDPDGRGVTGLLYDESRGDWWISTAGRGASRAEQPGRWERANEGLAMGIPYTAAFSEDGEVLMGTEAGLYGRSGQEEDSDWRLVDSRATSAIHGDSDAERRVTGTVGGSLVVRIAGQREHTSEAAPLGRGEELVFTPVHLHGTPIASSAILTVATRRESRDLIAWSHRQGPLISNDGGSSWRRMQLGEAFQTALISGEVTHFITTGSQVYFAVTRSPGADGPTQVWRTTDGGQTWQTTYSSIDDEDRSPLHLLSLEDGDGLLLAHGSRLALSTDRGETWSPLVGPWEEGKITGLTLDDDRVAMVVNLTHTSELLWVERPEDGARISQRLRIQWPEDGEVYAGEPLNLQVRGEQVLFHSGQRVYSGTITRGKTSGPGSIAILIAMGTVLALTTLAFGYLHAWER